MRKLGISLAVIALAVVLAAPSDAKAPFVEYATYTGDVDALTDAAHPGAVGVNPPCPATNEVAIGGGTYSSAYGDTKMQSDAPGTNVPFPVGQWSGLILNFNTTTKRHWSSTVICVKKKKIKLKYLISDANVIGAGGDQHAEAGPCPHGYALSSGGTSVTGAQADVFISGSGPTPAGLTSGAGAIWQSWAHNFGTGPASVTAYAICARKKDIKLTYVSAVPAQVGSGGGFTSSQKACPDGMQVIGGGTNVNAPNAPTGWLTINAPYDNFAHPQGPMSGWIGGAVNAGMTSEDLITTVICAKAPPV